MVFITGVNTAAWLLIQYWKKRKTVFFWGTAFVTGWCVSYSGYYGIVTILPVLAAVTWLCLRKDHDIKRSFYKTIVHLFCINTIGILLMAVLILPLFYYLMSDLKMIPPKFLLSHRLSQPAMFFNMFFPVTDKSFPGGFRIG